METFDNGIRKARKDHKCNYCGGIIKSGEEYNYSVHKMDDVYTWKSHKHCSELTILLNMDYGSEGLSDNDFYEYLNEYFHDDVSLADKSIFAYNRIKKNKEIKQ